MTTEELNAKEKDPSAEDEKDPSGVTVTIGDKEPEAPKEDSSTIKHMRRQIKEQSKQIKELRTNQVKETIKELGTKPTLEGSDHDEEVFSGKLIEWNNRKIALDSKAADKIAAQEKQDAEWQTQKDAHREKVTALGAEDYEYAEDVVKETFSEIQQSLIIDTALNSAVVVLALGNNPEEAKKLAGIKNHGKFISALARLESTMTVKKRTPNTQPEGKVESSGGGMVSSDKKLDQLRKKAEESGDYTEVKRYRKLMREKK